MALVTMREMLADARQKGYAVGGFEFWSFQSARAIVAVAEQENVPVILQTGPAECEMAGGYDIIGLIGRTVAEKAGVPVALHLDHGTDLWQAKAALEAGFSSVMIDASGLPYAQNSELTRRVVETANPFGASVESELGRLAGSEAQLNVSEAEALQTDPEEAFAFVRDTGIDALAVAIGTVHGFYRFKPEINIERLKKIAARVSVPLVLHGGSGTPEEKVREAIENGIAKVNICTEFIHAIGQQFIKTQQQPEFRYSIAGLFTPPYEAGKELVQKKIRLFTGR